VVKTGVSIPDELYEELRRLAEEKGYKSISSIIRDAIELFIAFNRWWLRDELVTGSIQVLVRDERALHRVIDVLESSRSIVKHFLVEPRSGASLVLGIVEGPGGEVKRLYGRMARLDGVLAIQASLLPAIQEPRLEEASL